MRKTLIVVPMLLSCMVITGYAAKHAQHRHHYSHHTQVVEQQQSDALDINHATVDDLVKLKGIGDKKAHAIVDYRDAHGPFASVDKLTDVKGIGQAMLERIRSENPGKLAAITK